MNIAFASFDLVGEAAGKAPFGVAKKEDVNMNLNQLRGKADSANSVISEDEEEPSDSNRGLVVPP